jgi:hypothetical protein
MRAIARTISVFMDRFRSLGTSDIESAGRSAGTCGAG